MTRKDYVLIAAALKEARNHVLRTAAADMDNAAIAYGLDAAALEVACALGDENPQFHRVRFLNACGVTA